MAYINVDEVYILDNTGLQVDQTTDLPFKDAGLTESQQAQARANIGAGGTNPNLIDNPWFTVQQRGTGPFTAAAAYTADRWQKSGANGIVTPTSDGLKFEKNGATYVEVRYYDTLDKYANAGNGKTFTLSIMLPDGSVQSKQFTMASSGLDTNVYFEISGTNDFRVNLYTTSTLFVVRVLCYTDFTLRAIKLEQGTVSTLANDTPPDYGTELLKCMRYFERIKPIQGNYANFGMGYASTTTQAIIFAPMQPKRDYTYTVTASGSFRVSDNARNYTASAVAKESGACASNTLVLYVTTTGTAMTAGTPVMFGAANSNACYIDISNDL